MFDIGFWELMLIGVVILVVVGPERLPRLARTAGLWIGKARYFIGNVKSEIEREIRADELKRIMEEQARSTGLHEIVEETRSSVDGVRSGLDNARADLDAQLEELQIASPEGSRPQSPKAEPPAAPEQPAVPPVQPKPQDGGAKPAVPAQERSAEPPTDAQKRPDSNSHNP